MSFVKLSSERMPRRQKQVDPCSRKRNKHFEKKTSKIWKKKDSGAAEILTLLTIEIGLEHAPFVVLVYFFPHLNMQKNLLIMDPTTLKTHH